MAIKFIVIVSVVLTFYIIYLVLGNYSFVWYSYSLLGLRRIFWTIELTLENDDSQVSSQPFFMYIILSLYIHGLFNGGANLSSLWGERAGGWGGVQTKIPAHQNYDIMFCFTHVYKPLKAIE